MEMDLSPRFASKQIFDGEGGSHNIWSPTEFPLLGEAKVGAGILLLKPGGFALPHYADSAKVGYVLQGEHGSVGMKLPKDKNSKEEIVLSLRTGDLIPLPLGAASWWHNNGNSDVVILFLGETSTAYVPGEFSYFFLTGALGILGGFSSDFISKAYGISETDTKTLVQSQMGALLVKLSLEEGQNLPLPQKDNANKWLKNIVNILPEVDVKRAGTATSFIAVNFPFLEEAGLSCDLVILEGNAMLSPMYNNDSMAQILYVAKGSGKVQIVGMNGKCFLDSNIVASQLLIVPRFFVFSIIADSEGIECFSIKTSSRPDVGELAGQQSVLNMYQSTVLKSALNVSPEFANFLKAKIAESEILIPPMN